MDIMFDVFNNPVPFEAYLATPDKKILGLINGIDKPSGNLREVVKDVWTLTFTVYRYMDDEPTDYYDQLSRFMRIKIPKIGWFIMEEPTINNNGTVETKEVTAYSEDYVFIQSDLKGWKINCGTTDSQEMLVDGNVEDIGGVEFAKEQIRFYWEERPELSLFNLLIQDYPDWSIGYVDDKPKAYTQYVDGETITTYKLLKDEIGTFNIDNKSRFAFMTQDLPQYFECILVFDINNLKVHAYRAENIGKDTNITLDFKNYENSHSITVDENSIYTRYYVSGADDLNILYSNFGSNYIENIDYFLRTDIMPQTLIDKYRQWKSFCNLKRQSYIELTRSYNKQLDIVSELENRVPLDGCSEDWATMSDEQLLEAKSTYEAQKKGLEEFYVDEDGNFDEEALATSPDANTYYQIRDVILPNIEIALKNHSLPSSSDMEDYIDSYKTDWKLYGVSELEVNLQIYKERVVILEQNHYDLTYEEYQQLYQSDPEKYSIHTVDGHALGHEEYVAKKQQLNGDVVETLQWHYNQRVAERDEAQSVADNYNEQRQEIVKQTNKQTWEDEDLGGFAEEEIDLINKLLNETDYINENIIITSQDSIDDIITAQTQLFNLATSDLEITSQPQFQYTTSIDNFMSDIENQDWTEELAIYDYIHLGISDNILVKLRLSSIEFNPFLLDNNLSLTFTNMLKSRTKRSDLAELIASGSNASKNSVTTSYQSQTGSGDASVYLTSAFIQKLVNSDIFKNAVNNSVSGNYDGVIGGSVNAGNLEAEMIKCTDIYAENGFFQYLQAQLIAVDQIVANSGIFEKLRASVAQIDNLLAGNVSAELGHLIELTAQNVRIDEAVIKDLIAAQITVSMLKAGEISSDKFNIVSDDGSMTIVGNTMQFRDENDIVRIQIGKDETGNFTFVLYDETGKGVLIDSEGIKESAIEDGLIKTDMVADGAITESKIDKTGILEWTDEEGNKIFQIGKMYFGDEKFEVSYNQTVEKVNQTYEKVEDLANRIGSISIMGDQIFKEIQGVMTPASITLRAVCRNNVEVGTWYIDDVENTEYVSEDGESITIPSSFMVKKDSAVIKVTDSLGDLYDIQTIYRISDSEGATGQAAISVIITSDKGTTFDENTTIESTVCTCTVYEGVQEIVPNSYNWLAIDNDGDHWTSIGTDKQVTINIDKAIIRKRLRCEVDIDI